MRALIRMRTLAAVCALLLMIAGTAAAGPRVRFDRPGQPDVPDPPMVGDPDDSQGLVVIPVPFGIVVIRVAPHQMQIFRRAQPPATPVRIQRPTRFEMRRGANAR